MREFQSRMSGSVVEVMPDTGHGVQADQTQLFNQAIVESLDTVESTR